MRRLSLYNLVFAILILLISLAFEASAQTYPQLDISGYKKYEYRSLDVSPLTNYSLALGNVGGFYLYGAGPWQERLTLRILGRLSERLSVSYDLEQQPELPEKYNIKVTYDKHELTFGDFNAIFSGNEFANASKSLNGMMITSRDSYYDLILVPSSRVKSMSQKLSSQRGNNTAGPYSLGHSSIIEGSEIIELNGVRLSRDKDYTIDYFEGKVTFFRILTSDDEFRYSYEYTNILDLFFPTISKRDFFGLRGSVTLDPTTIGRGAPKEEQIQRERRDIFPTTIIKPPLLVTTEATVGTFEIEVRERIDRGIPAGDVLINGNVVLTLHDIGEQLKGVERAKIVAARIMKHVQGVLTPEALTIGKVSAEPVSLAKGKVIFTVDEREAKIWGISGKELALKWIEAINSSFLSPKLVKITVVGTAEAPVTLEEKRIVEDESTGLYTLKSRPVIRFSEEVIFGGTTLRKDLDYLVDYNSGTIKLLTSVLPSKEQTMSVTYRYPETKDEAEVISGGGARGPYLLAHKWILEKSERVLVDELPYVRDLDYIMDYENGKITFQSKISQTQTVKITYRYRVFVLPPPPEVPPLAQSISIGGTYLRESTKKGQGTATATIIETIKSNTTYKTADIIDKNYTIYLSYFPLTSTGEVTVKVNNITLAYGTDYVIPTTEADAGGNAVVYPADTRIGFRVSPNTNSIAYLTDKKDLSDGLYTGTIKLLSTLEATDEVTVVYTYAKSIYKQLERRPVSNTIYTYYLSPYRNILPGSESVLVWSGDASTPYYRNTSIEVYDFDYSINYNKDNPYITFNPGKLDGKTYFSVIFSYVPPSVPLGSDIAQDNLGLDATYKVGDILKLEGSLARSNADRVYIAISTVETITITAPTNTITLSKKPVIENSEKVYINDFLRTKDNDYFINYTDGVIRFYYTTLTTADAVRVEYLYESAGGVPAGEEKMTGGAYKLGGSTKLPLDLEVSGNWKGIEPDFLPMGSTPIGVGSTYREYNGAWKPAFATLRGSYIERFDQVGTNVGYFNKSYDRLFSLSSDPYDLFHFDSNYKLYSTVNDPPLPGEKLSEGKLESYSAGIILKTWTFGQLTNTNKFDGRKTISETFLDKDLQTTTVTDYFHINNAFTYPRIGFTFDFQHSEPKTTITEEAVTAWSISRDTSYDLSLDFTFPQIKKLSAITKHIFHDQEDKLGGPGVRTRNTTLYGDFIPVSELTTSYSINRQETQSVLVGGENPMTERMSLSSRYTPPFIFSGISWGGSWDRSAQESGAKSWGTSNSYGLDFIPVPLTQDIKLQSKFSAYVRTSVSISDVTTNTNSWSGSHSLTLSPYPLLTITPSFSHEDYFNEVIPGGYPTKALILNGSIFASYKPWSDLDLSSQITYKDSIDKTINKDYKKYITEGHAIYKVWSYWNLTGDIVFEDNRGEIQGGILTELDFGKTTTALGVNVTLPQDNIILSSVVLKAAYKKVDYVNRANESNNFTAHLLTFEGTLNF